MICQYWCPELIKCSWVCMCVHACRMHSTSKGACHLDHYKNHHNAAKWSWIFMKFFMIIDENGMMLQKILTLHSCNACLHTLPHISGYRHQNWFFKRNPPPPPYGPITTNNKFSRPTLEHWLIILGGGGGVCKCPPPTGARIFWWLA